MKKIPSPSSLTILCMFFILNGAWAGPDKKVPTLPPLVLCTQKGHVAHVSHGGVDWEYDRDGQAKGIQTQPAVGRVLVVGGPRQVCLIRKVDSGVRVLWDWSSLEGVSIVSAVGAEWDLKGEPSLILGADALGKRLILAEAKSMGTKLRWEYALPSPPLKVKVCPDDGNFLVLLENGAVEEIQFQENKVIWQRGPSSDGGLALDLLRDPGGNTFFLQSDGEALSIQKDLTVAWNVRLPYQDEKRKPNSGSLSLFKNKGRRWLMVSIHDGVGPGATDLVYLLNAENGKVVDFSDHLGKEAYPPLVSAQPAEPFYFRKE
jgi:hypothetical protein